MSTWNSQVTPVDFSVKEPTGFEKFATCTSFHGPKYIYTESGRWRKFLWCLVSLGALCGCGFFMILNLNEFISSTTLTSIDSTSASLQDITFPSVYICNVNQVSKTFLSRLVVNNTNVADLPYAKKILFDQFLDGERQNMTENENETYRMTLDILKNELRKKYSWNENSNFVTLSSQNCSDMILYAEWATDISHKFYDSFQGITDYGACCLIVPYLDFVNNRTRNLPPSEYVADDFHNIPAGSKNGQKKGLKLILDVESFDYAYFPRSAKGFKITIADARDKAVVNQDGYYLRPGTATLVPMVPSMINTTENAINRFNSKDRSCYLDKEFYFANLKWIERFRYSIRNCLYEAVIEETIQRCSCFPPFFKTKYPNAPLPICVGINLTCSLHWSNLMASKDKSQPDMTTAMSNDSRELDCMTRCKLQMQNMAPSYAIFPAWETFLDRIEICLVLQKLATKVCQDDVRRKVFEQNNDSNTTCRDITELYFVQGLCNSYDVVTPNKTLLLPYQALTKYLYNYSLDNMVVLNLFFKDPVYTRMKKDEKLTVIQFIANAGGLLGLCMGISFVGIFESCYHVFNFWFTKTYKSTCANPLRKDIRKGLKEY